MIKIASYNCNSDWCHFENVRNILCDVDILFLQELQLCKSDLLILNDLNSDFEVISFVHDRESEGIIEGRPSRGVAILWRSRLSAFVSPLIIDDSMIAITITNRKKSILLLNVYMPCDLQTSDALENYRCMLSKIEVIIREQNVTNLIIAGDFNADQKKGRFWNELLYFMQTFSLLALDDQLPQDTFTYLCPARSTTSFLDHVLCSKNLKESISNLFVNYEISLYDHFPLYFNLEFELAFNRRESDAIVSHDEFVDWKNINKADKDLISNKLDDLITGLNLVNDEILNCQVIGCKSRNHRKRLDEIFFLVKKVLIESTSDFKFTRKRRCKTVPGWNEYVKELHSIARNHFLQWRLNGNPLEGPALNNMKSSRSRFKSALKNCKYKEDDIKNKKMVGNLLNKNYKDFWKEVHANKNGNMHKQTVIDNESSPQNIADNFSAKYSKILDKHQNGFSKAETIQFNQSNCNKDSFVRIGKVDVKNAIDKLKCSIGHDFIHSNHLKYSTELFRVILAMLLSSFIIHSYIPAEVISGVINPTLKDPYNCLNESGNYRPVMSSSVFLKILEYCILFRINDFIILNDRQHGFREGYSTSTSAFILKETVFNYCKGNSCVYACFLDISKAFDSIDHGILIEKLLQMGIPEMIVDLIKYWYSNQYVKVRYNSNYSGEWKICNGVRQGGVLSGLFFSLYIDGLISKISNMGTGCQLGIYSSNVIAYADDIVLLAPSPTSLQNMMDVANLEASKLDLTFNPDKSKIMIFDSKGRKNKIKRQFYIGSQPISQVTNIKYLGNEISSDLCCSNDIISKLKKFYAEFNQILRKFCFTDIPVKLFLFKQFCLQIYGV